MILAQITHLNRKRLVVTFTLVSVVTVLCLWKLQLLGCMLVCLTFYPAVIYNANSYNSWLNY